MSQNSLEAQLNPQTGVQPCGQGHIAPRSAIAPHIQAYGQPEAFGGSERLISNPELSYVGSSSSEGWPPQSPGVRCGGQTPIFLPLQRISSSAFICLLQENLCYQLRAWEDVFPFLAGFLRCRGNPHPVIGRKGWGGTRVVGSGWWDSP